MRLRFNSELRDATDETRDGEGRREGDRERERGGVGR